MAADQSNICDILDEMNDDGEAINLLPEMSKQKLMNNFAMEENEQDGVGNVKAENDVLDQINKDAEEIVLDLLPEKSKIKYIRCYDKFMAWKANQGIEAEYFSENVMLVYFDGLKCKFAFL